MYQLDTNGTNTKALIEGFTRGFSIHYQGNDFDYISHNSPIAYSHPNIVYQKIMEEVAVGRMAGPFKKKPFKHFRVSPLSVRAKKDGGYRLILNLSAPYDENSINSGISKEDSSVQYSSISDAISIIQSCPKAPFCCKTDIKKAFRIIPIREEDHHLLGMGWDGSYYYDKFLPMGCSSSCKLFTSVSNTILWIAKNKYGI